MEDTQITQEVALADSYGEVTPIVDVLPDGYMDSVRKGLVDGKLMFSVVDVIGKLVGKEKRAATFYWNRLKQTKSEQGIQLYENFIQLKLRSNDGKLYKTDCANLEGMLRIIQEVPSPKAEPIKRWLAQVGVERIAEEANPDLIHERWVNGYVKRGKSLKWIEARSQGLIKRHHFTDTLKEHNVQGKQYGFITAAMHRTVFGKNPSQDKADRGLAKSASLRDAMSDTELLLVALAESSATDIINDHNSNGYKAVNEDSIQGAEVAKIAKDALERKLGRSISARKEVVAK